MSVTREPKPPTANALQPAVSTPTPTGWARTFSSLAIPDYRMLWTGMFFSTAAMQMNIISRGWLAYEISGSGLALGVVTLARGLPMLVFSLLGGVAADRVDKRKLLMATQTTMGLLALVNAVLVHAGVIQVWHLVVIGLLQGSVFPFNMPARQAYIPELVGEDQLANAVAMNSTGMNINRVLAPVVGGALIAWSPTVAFYAIALLYVGAVVTLFRLPPARTPEEASKGTVAEMTTGLRYIWGSPALLTLIGMAFIPVLLGMPYQQLLPVFQKDVLEVGPSRLGFMFGAVGVGSLIGSLTIAYLSDYPRKGLLQLFAGVVFGTGLVAFALSQTYLLSLALLVLVGFASQGYMTINSVLVMLNTDRELYGRVMSVYMITWSLMPISMLPMGALVDVLGAPATVAGAGALLALFITIAGAANPTHRRLRTEAAGGGG